MFLLYLTAIKLEKEALSALLIQLGNATYELEKIMTAAKLLNVRHVFCSSSDDCVNIVSSGTLNKVEAQPNFAYIVVVARKRATSCFNCNGGRRV